MSKKVFDNYLLEFMKETIVADNYRDLATRILKLFAEKIKADIATLWRAVKEDDKQKLILATSYEVEFLPTEEEITYDILPDNTPNIKIKGLTAWMAIKKLPVIAFKTADLKDETKKWAGSHSGQWDDKQFWKGKKFGCLIGYPIMLEGALLGVIKFERYSDSLVFTNQDVKKVKQWADPIALALKGMTAREEQERKRQSAMRDLCSKLLMPASVTFFEDIVNYTAKILNADISTLWLFDDKKRVLYLAAQYGLNPSTIETSPVYKIPKERNVPDSEIYGLTAWTFYRNRPFYAHNWERLKDHPSHKGLWDKAQWEDKPEEKFGCLYAAPLISDGVPIGVIKVEKRNAPDFMPFTEVERATFDLIAVIVSVGPALKAVIRDRETLVLDYFHILRAPTANAISVLDMLRRELNRSGGPRNDRIETLLKMLSNNLAVAYTQTLNAFEIATKPERPFLPRWHNLQSIIQPSKEMLVRLFPDVEVVEDPNLKSYEILLTDYQVKKMNVILHNLIDNAITFSHNHPVAIRSTMDKNNKNLKLSVIDKGIGIAKKHLEDIWKSGVSFRPGKNERPESRGQGLAIVKRIIEEFNWNKSIVSRPNEGTKISIHISQIYWRKAK